MKCACVAMVVSVCKKVNQVFFKIRPPPPIQYWEHWSYIHFILNDFLLSFLEQVLIHYNSSRSSIWLSASWDAGFVSLSCIGLLQPGDLRPSPALSQARGSLPRLSHSALPFEQWGWMKVLALGSADQPPNIGRSMCGQNADCYFLILSFIF